MPLSYGDRNPSDVDDVVPVDPTVNFSETNARDTRGSDVNVNATRQFDFKQIAKTETPHTQDAFFCIVQQSVTTKPAFLTAVPDAPYWWLVALENGRLIYAKTYISNISESDSGIVVKGLYPDEWYLITESGELELINFELKEDLASDADDAEAYVLDSDFEHKVDAESDEEVIVTVVNKFHFSGVGLDNNDKGSIGVAISVSEIGYLIINIDPRSDTIIGKLDADLTYGSSATVSIWDKSSGSFADTGNNETAYDWLLKSGKKLASGSKVVCQKIGSIYVVTESDNCPS